MSWKQSIHQLRKNLDNIIEDAQKREREREREMEDYHQWNEKFTKFLTGKKTHYIHS